MEKTFKRLFSDWKLNGFPIKNRICVPPLVIYTWSDDTGRVTDKRIAHYEALVNGGAGLVIQEATSVCREGRLTLDQLGIWEDGQIDGLKRIADVLHRAEMPAIIQLSHAGLLGAKPSYQVAPSAYQCVGNGAERSGRALTVDEIHMIEQQFIDGAKRAVQAGYDGVELHASHGYLLSEFMNPKINRRTDEYNAKDLLLLRHIIEGIQRVTPPHFIIGVRMGVFEPDLQTGIQNAKWLEAQGVDFIDAFYGCDWQAELEKPDDFPFNSCIYGAKCVKEAVSIPVFAVYQISSGEQAEAILRDTSVDMVVIGRGSLVNYSWGNDVRAGRDPGHCLNCALCMWKVDPEKCPGKALLRQNRQTL